MRCTRTYVFGEVCTHTTISVIVREIVKSKKLTHIRSEYVRITPMENFTLEVGRERPHAQLVVLQGDVAVRGKGTRLRGKRTIRKRSAARDGVYAHQNADVAKERLGRLVEDVGDLVLKVLRRDCCSDQRGRARTRQRTHQAG